jgi:hypothetical protein
MHAVFECRSGWKLLRNVILAALVLIAITIGLLAWMAWARSYHPKAGSCSLASAEWKLMNIAQHVQDSNLLEFVNDGKDVALLGGDVWDEHQGVWTVPFATGYGKHQFTAIITCDGISEFSGR